MTDNHVQPAQVGTEGATLPKHAMRKPKMSEIIRARIQCAAEGGDEEAKFFSTDNISRFIESEEEMDRLQAEVQEAFQGVLNALVIDTDNDHNTNGTAARVAKMYLRETFSGRYEQAPSITEFPNVANYDGIYVTGPIEVRSTCAHHMLPIIGDAWIAVMPDKDVIGLSKFNRTVSHIAQRPHIQEEMTLAIADAVEKACNSKNVAVLVKATHCCMLCRGVQAAEPSFSTPIMRGAFKKSSLRSEFYSLVNLKG